MITTEQLNREFNRWYYDEQYPEGKCNRATYHGDFANPDSLADRDYWMREAFKAGFQAAKVEGNQCVDFDYLYEPNNEQPHTNMPQLRIL